MLATITGNFVSISQYNFKNEQGEALISYKVILLDEDEIRGDSVAKSYKVKEKALQNAKLLDENTKRQVVGKTITLHGRFLPKYLKNSKIWVEEFKADSITF